MSASVPDMSMSSMGSALGGWGTSARDLATAKPPPAGTCREPHGARGSVSSGSPPPRGGPTILVTGGLGMIGAHTARVLVDLGHEVAADALQAITPGLRLDLLPGRQNGPGDDPYLDTNRLTQETGFAPTFNVANAVADYVACRADNPR